jgi:hypothetical protein
MVFEVVFDCGSCREKRKLYNVRNVFEYLVIYCCTHNMNKSTSGRFIFVDYYTVVPQC